MLGPLYDNLLRCPNVRLKLPTINRPKSMTVFAFVFLSYFLVLSGIIYDIIIEPPSIGSTQDPITGQSKPVAFLQYRINGQYIMEGLSAGFMFALGGFGFIVLDMANDKQTSIRNKYILLIAGILSVCVAYNLCLLFLRIKIPGYLIVE
eukprot:GFYU01009794.1.p1 GENE.GFYU01009794.1~~GFYU01009794.1.p1  ORF type:complete len:149 (-),score=44.10 GFYU01009794.1:325-771(-)